MQIKNFPYHLFDDFLMAFRQKQSFVNKEIIEDLFSKPNVEQTYKQFAENSRIKKDEEFKDKPFDDVVKNIKGDNVQNVQTMYYIINHALWLWAFPHDTKSPWLIYEGAEQSNKTKKMNCPYKENLMMSKGVAGGGRGYRTQKTNGIRFILYLFNVIENNTIVDEMEMKEKIKEECNKKTYSCDSVSFDVPDGVKNLLLHLCDTDLYEPIAFTADKQKLVDTFIEKNSNHDFTIDQKIQEIRQKLQQKKIFTEGDTFYSKSLPLMWKGEESSTDLSLAQKLEYKKAMILYGPPGTGKTYIAMQLAKEIVARHYYREFINKSNENNQNNAYSIFDDIENNRRERINYLQFHINYNYEDFIAGQIIMGGSIETKKGFIFDVIEKAKKNSKMPYVVILDEINRTDISRVFGELFTAIEKRGEDVTLTFPAPKEDGQMNERLVLNLPENIYFIGTMNEIDFSLERIDFALRRRFIWELKDYSTEALENIINYRFDSYPYDELFKFYKGLDYEEQLAKETTIRTLSNLGNIEKDTGELKNLKQRLKAFSEEVKDERVHLWLHKT